MEIAKAKRTAYQSESIAVDKVLGNSDLLAKILNLLPPKPLVRSKAVSNHWLTLISDPHFLLDYSSRLYTSQSPSSFSHFYCDTTPISLDGCHEIIPKIDLFEVNYKLHILHSCNGLMLCQYGFGTPMLLINPTTNKHRLIPLPYEFYDSTYGTFLAFDPSRSIHYKVESFRFPRFSLLERVSYLFINIFSSESGSWKEICLPAPPDWLGVSMSTIFWRGALHLINRRNFHMQFHIEEEKFTWNQISIAPSTLHISKNMEYYIVKCDNGLLAIKVFRVGNSLEFDQNGLLNIFEMDKDSNLWTLKHEIDLKPLLFEFPEMNMNRFSTMAPILQLVYTVMYVRIEADEETVSLILAIQRKIILYSAKVKNNQFTAKVLKEVPYYGGSHYAFHPYIQCLVPV